MLDYDAIREAGKISPERQAIFEGLREAMGLDAFKVFADILIDTAKKAKREGMMEGALAVYNNRRTDRVPTGLDRESYMAGYALGKLAAREAIERAAEVERNDGTV